MTPLLLVAAALAGEPRVTLGWGTGVDARLGKGAVFVGVGGGPTLSVAITPHVDVHAEARWLWLAGSSGLGRVGVGGSLQKGMWSPGAGLDLTLFVEPALRAVTADNPTLASPVAPAVQLRLNPLRFRSGRWTAEVLRVEIGAGWDRGALAPAFGATLAEVGIGW